MAGELRTNGSSRHVGGKPSGDGAPESTSPGVERRDPPLAHQNSERQGAFGSFFPLPKSHLVPDRRCQQIPETSSYRRPQGWLKSICVRKPCGRITPNTWWISPCLEAPRRGSRWLVALRLALRTCRSPAVDRLEVNPRSCWTQPLDCLLSFWMAWQESPALPLERDSAPSGSEAKQDADPSDPNEEHVLTAPSLRDVGTVRHQVRAVLHSALIPASALQGASPKASVCVGLKVVLSGPSAPSR